MLTVSCYIILTFVKDDTRFAMFFGSAIALIILVTLGEKHGVWARDFRIIDSLFSRLEDDMVRNPESVVKQIAPVLKGEAGDTWDRFFKNEIHINRYFWIN
jgi:hypothetical protein